MESMACDVEMNITPEDAMKLRMICSTLAISTIELIYRTTLRTIFQTVTISHPF